MAESLNSNESEDEVPDQRVAELIDQYLQVRRTTDRSPKEVRREFIQSNTDLANLEEFLRVAEITLSASPRYQGNPTSTSDESWHPESTTLANSNPNRQFIPERIIRVTCGHCGNKLRIVAPAVQELSCPSCGSAIDTDLTVTRSDPLQSYPKSIGRFTILGRLGSGAFGHAYRAYDPQLAREVAIKVPRSGSFSSDIERERFVREAKSAARLRHPNIVQVHEVSVDGERPYLVCDLVDGVTLSDLIGSRRLPFRKSAEMMLDIAMAVQFAHDNNIIHRDIKPGNILLDQNQKPYIADFGLARDTGIEVTMTATGEVLGTPAYMSPEQARGESSKLTCVSDVYSLGVVFYRMVCGELPFRGSQRMLLNQVLHDDPKPPCRINESIPRDLETIVMKAMAKETVNRYGTAREFADDLRRWMNDESIVARPDGKLTRLVRWRRRHPAIANLVAFIAGLLVLVALLSIAWAVNANWLSGLAQQNAALAKENELESVRRLHLSHLQNGIVEMVSGEPGTAIVWLASALGLDPTNEDLQRTRIGMLWGALPDLKAVIASSKPLTAMAVARNGSRIAIGNKDGSVTVHKSPDFDKIQYNFSQGTTVRLSQFGGPDDLRLVTVGIDNTARLWNSESGEAVARLDHVAEVRTAIFSLDGLWVATAGMDGTAKIWSATDGKLVHELVHPVKELNLLAFSPDSRNIVVSSRADYQSPSVLSVWKIDESVVLEHKLKSSGITNSLEFSSDGHRIIVGSFMPVPEKYNVETWDLNSLSGEEPYDPELSIETRNPVSSASFLERDGGLLTVESNGEITRWDALGIHQQTTLHPSGVTAVAIDPEQQFLAVSGSNGNTILYWVATLEPISGSIPNGNSATETVFLKDNRYLVTGGEHGVVRVWDLAGITRHQVLLPHDSSVTDVQISPDSNSVLTTCSDGSARFWDVESGEQQGTKLEHPDACHEAAFSSDGKTVATTCEDHYIRVWNARDGSLVAKPFAHPDATTHCRFSPDDDLLASCAADGSVFLTNKPFESPVFRFNHSAHVFGLEFSPDKKLLATGSIDKTVRVWSTQDGSSVGSALEHTSQVGEIGFSHDGNFLATACLDPLVRIWSVPNFQLARTVTLSSFPTTTEYLPGDKKMLTSEEYGLVCTWNLNTEPASILQQVRIRDYYLIEAQFCKNSSLVMAFGNSNAMSGNQVMGAGAVFLIDMDSGSPLSPPLRHCSSIRQAEIDPNGQFVVSGSSDGTAMISRLSRDSGEPESIAVRASLYSGWRLKDDAKLVPVNADETRAILDDNFRDKPISPPDSNAQLRWDGFLNWLNKNCQPNHSAEAP